jgi:hypothetical protein
MPAYVVKVELKLNPMNPAFLFIRKIQIRIDGGNRMIYHGRKKQILPGEKVKAVL